MPRSRRLLPLLPALSRHDAATRLTQSPAALLASLALLATVTSAAGAQERAAPDTPLHLAMSRFEFVASGDTLPPVKPLRVHNGGTVRFTDVRLARVAYADSSHGSEWLVALPRQSAVAPDELATVAALCIDAAGLKAGTYRATAAVSAREVPAPVPVTITLVVTDAGARARRAAPRCTPSVAK